MSVETQNQVKAILDQAADGLDRRQRLLLVLDGEQVFYNWQGSPAVLAGMIMVLARQHPPLVTALRAELISLQVGEDDKPRAWSEVEADLMRLAGTC